MLGHALQLCLTELQYALCLIKLLPQLQMYSMRTCMHWLYFWTHKLIHMSSRKSASMAASTLKYVSSDAKPLFSCAALNPPKQCMYIDYIHTQTHTPGS